MSTADIPGKKRRTGIIVMVAVLGGLLVSAGGAFAGMRILGGTGDVWETMERLGGKGCFNRTKGDGEGAFVPEGLEPASCAAPHDAEMMSRLAKEDKDMPAEYDHVLVRQMIEGAGDACAYRMIHELADTMTVPANADLRWYLPTEQQYADGHRGMYCYYAFDGDLPAQTVRYVPRGLTEDQMRFPMNAALLHHFEAIAFRKDDVVHRQKATGDVLYQLARRRGVYSKGFDSVRPQIDALLAEDTVRQNLWDAAGRAADEAAFEAILAQLGGAGPTATELAVRAAIGLPTAQGGPITE